MHARFDYVPAYRGCHQRRRLIFHTNFVFLNRGEVEREYMVYRMGSSPLANTMTGVWRMKRKVCQSDTAVFLLISTGYEMASLSIRVEWENVMY